MLYIPYPSWIHPQVFPGIPFLGLIRWYGLMYIVAFATAFFVAKSHLKKGLLNTQDYTATEDDLFSFFTYGIIGLLLGARIFSALIYDTSHQYWKEPWLIFWPFDKEGNFTGLAGMSYHGGVIGGFIGMVIWLIKNKRPMFQWIDMMAVAIPAGYTFGRLGNFLNGELFGRITTMPWGMVFPYAQKFSASLPWVQEFAAEIGMVIPNQGLVNLPRHPSQLYEALFEGIFLSLFLMLLQKKKPFSGFLSGMYFVGYGIARFIIEYFREPDYDLGYRIAKVQDAPTYLNVSLLNISTGQILCFLMILGGIGLIIGRYFYLKKKDLI